MALIRPVLMSSSGSRDCFAIMRAFSAGTSGLQGLVRDCSGAAAMEFPIVLFPLLLLLLGTFDIGIAMLTTSRLNFAVEAAAKCGPSVRSACLANPDCRLWGFHRGASGPRCLRFPLVSV